MTEEQIREIIRHEFQEFIASDRFIFHKLVQFLDGRNIQLSKGTGTKIGTETNQKLGFYNATPVIQQTAITGVDNQTVDTTYGTQERDVIGNCRTRINEIETALENLGLIASN